MVFTGQKTQPIVSKSEGTYRIHNYVPL